MTSHIVNTTSGLVHHSENTSGFNLEAVKFLIVDEADRIVNSNRNTEIEKILKMTRRDTIISETKETTVLEMPLHL